MAKKTILDLGFSIGKLPRGALNHLVDVGGIGVAHRSYRDPKASVCTGFTVIQPGPGINSRFAASVATLNGSGELTAAHQIREWGFFDTPIVLTNTPSVGRAYDVVSEWMMARDPAIGEKTGVVIPVVGECDDSVLNAPRNRVWGREELFGTLDEALAVSQGRAPRDSEGVLAQGDVGGGTGMTSYDFKAGIGSASRKIKIDGAEYTVGVMLMTNFGMRDQLTVLGRPVGQLSKAPLPKKHREGSCIGILATDAPLGTLALERLARRIGVGLVRTGCHAHHGSGEIFMAFSTTKEPRFVLEWESEQWNPLFWAAIEAAEEAVYNSLLCSNPVENARASVPALTAEALADLLDRDH